jgi:hypothetical protein
MHSTLVRYLFLSLLNIFIVFIYGTPGYSQSDVKGVIVNDADGKPIGYASVGVKGKRAGVVADASGNFHLSLPANIKLTDTVIVSSIGYQNIRIPVKQALQATEFRLQAIPKEMTGVTHVSFVRQSILGNNSSGGAFFRAWYDYKTGGEIGKMISVPQRQYKIDRIRFKVDNKCDTCWMRLHIRKAVNSVPGEELLQQNIIFPVTSYSVTDAGPEIDLSDYNIILSDYRIYVGLEVINCSNSESPYYSLCFIGEENGEYLYKPFTNSDWENNYQHGLALRLYLSY